MRDPRFVEVYDAVPFTQTGVVVWRVPLGTERVVRFVRTFVRTSGTIRGGRDRGGVRRIETEALRTFLRRFLAWVE